MNRTLTIILSALLVAGAVVSAVTTDHASARTPATTTTTVYVDPVYQYDLCRLNGPGRTHAIADINAYYQTWDQPQADQVVADINEFITVCHGLYNTGNIISKGKVVKTCFVDWAGYLPTQGACYAYWDTYPNALPNYHHYLLVSSV